MSVLKVVYVYLKTEIEHVYEICLADVLIL